MNVRKKCIKAQRNSWNLSEDEILESEEFDERYGGGNGGGTGGYRDEDDDDDEDYNERRGVPGTGRYGRRRYGRGRRY